MALSSGNYYHPPGRGKNHTFSKTLGWILVLIFMISSSAFGKELIPSPSPKDSLILTNGDHLTGSLEKIAKGKIYFKTDETGLLTITLGKVEELRTKNRFAVIITTPRDPYIGPGRWIPLGEISLFKNLLEVHTPGGLKVLFVRKGTYIVSENAYLKSIGPSMGLLHGWEGSITMGASNVTSTQNVNTYTSSIALIRTFPSTKDPWRSAENRTILGFSSTYGSISQPNTPEVQTNILHGNLEQDRYFSSRGYILAQAVFDQNSTQGLNLQQLYGVGLGYTPIKNSHQQLDFTITGDYTRQQFTAPADNKELVGTSIGDTYSYKFSHNIDLAETGSITPVWNNMNAYFANISVSLTIPVAHMLGFSLQVIDSYLNDPAPGFTRNSIQINSGLTYMIK